MTGSWQKPTFGVIVLVAVLAGLAYGLRPSAPTAGTAPMTGSSSPIETLDAVVSPTAAPPSLPAASIDPKRIVDPPPAKTAVGKCPDGQLSISEPGRLGCARLVDGGVVPEGTWTFVDANGAATTGQFVNGSKEGKWTTWSPSGKAIMSQTYAGNVLDGLQIEWTEGGQRIAERPFKAGALHGTVVLHRPDGTTVIEEWKEGERVHPDGG